MTIINEAIMIEQRLLDEFVAECKDDYVGLWSFVREVKDCNPMSSDNSIRHEVIKALSDLCLKNKVVVGEFDSTGNFFIWSSPILESMRIIEKKWIELDRVPDIGDIVWFTLMD